MANIDDLYQEETIDIKKYITKFLSNWYWFVICAFISISVAYLVSRYTDPIYQVNSTILVHESNNNSYYNDEMIQSLQFFKQGSNIRNQIGILRSYELNRKVLNELDFNVSYYGVGRIRDPELYEPAQLKVIYDTAHYQLYGQPVYVEILSPEEYRIEVDGVFSDKRLMRFGESYENDYFKFSIIIRDPSVFYESNHDRYYFVINHSTQLINQYRSKLSIGFLDEEGTILNLSTQGFVPLKECNYLNKLVEVYIRWGLEEKNQIAVNTINFIDQQIENIVDSLSVTEGILQQFRMDNKIIDLTQEGRSLYVQFESLETEKATLNIEAKYFEYLQDYLSEKNKVQDIIVHTSVGVRDQLLVNLILQINALNSERLSVKFQSVKSNPKLELIDNQIAELRKMLDENVSNLIKTNQITKDELDKRITLLNADIEKLPYNERRMISIRRKFDLNDQIYTYLLEKRAEAGITQASNVPNASMLDRARPDQSYIISPKKKMNYMIALVMGLLIPFLVIILKDYFNTKIISKSDIESKTNASILGVVGHNDKQGDLVVMDNPKTSISESFRTIKTNLQYLMLDKNSKIITVTSTVSGEGKTFCSMNLATITAMTHKKTLLIGMDLRKPRLHNHFAIDNSMGLSNYLIGKVSKEEIVQQTRVPGLFVVPSGPVPPNPAQLLETKALEEFVIYVRSEFDYIIVDTPPIALVSDALIFSKFSDVNIFVIRQNFSHKDVLDLVNDFNKNDNIPDFNILVNDVTMPGYYGKKYGYGYGYGYGTGYYDDDKTKLTFYQLILSKLGIGKYKFK